MGQIVFSILIITGIALMGCTTTQPTGSYAYQKEALPATAAEKVGRLEPGGDAERQAVERWKRVFADFTEAGLKTSVRAAYGTDVRFYDTLKVVEGVDALEHYLIESAKAVESCEVEIQDEWRSGDEFYFRWAMHIRFKKLKKGETTSSTGISHLRFDKDGMVVMHHDYWDAADGFFEHVPAIGWGIRKIKGRL
jgi:hypothetical protein